MKNILEVYREHRTEELAIKLDKLKKLDAPDCMIKETEYVLAKFKDPERFSEENFYSGKTYLHHEVLSYKVLEGDWVDDLVIETADGRFLVTHKAWYRDFGPFPKALQPWCKKLA